MVASADTLSLTDPGLFSWMVPVLPSVMVMSEFGVSSDNACCLTELCQHAVWWDGAAKILL